MDAQQEFGVKLVSSFSRRDPSFGSANVRLMCCAARHRMHNFYGEQSARLSRTQGLLAQDPFQESFTFRSISLAVSLLLFSVPKTYSNDLRGLWVDEIVYANAYNDFISSTVAEWKESIAYLIALIGMSVMFKLTVLHAANSFGASYNRLQTLSVASGNGLPAVALASLAMSLTGILAGLMLTHRHRTIVGQDATNFVSNYHVSITFILGLIKICTKTVFLTKYKHSFFGFRPLAFAYSLPRALLYWSLCLFALQTAISCFQILDAFMASALLGFAAVLVCSVALGLRGSLALWKVQPARLGAHLPLNEGRTRV